MDNAAMSTPLKRILLRVAAVSVTTAGLVTADALAQAPRPEPRSQLGIANVIVREASRKGGSRDLVILYQGREFAKLAAPLHKQRALYCCNPVCTPITPNTALICQIVINCPAGSAACFPQ